MPETTTPIDPDELRRRGARIRAAAEAVVNEPWSGMGPELARPLGVLVNEALDLAEQFGVPSDPDVMAVDPIVPAGMMKAAYRVAEAGASFTLFGRRYAPVGMSADASLRADVAHLQAELDRLRS